MAKLHISDRQVEVAYGEDVDDEGERFFNEMTARECCAILNSLGWLAGVVPLRRGDIRVPGAFTFNLCDGDDEFIWGMETYARALESAKVRHTGSGFRVLALAKDKTLEWLPAAMRPSWWSSLPED